MSRRPGILVLKLQPADGGVSPNQYVPRITAEIRVHWPPLATETEVSEALESAVEVARQKIRDKFERTD